MKKLFTLLCLLMLLCISTDALGKAYDFDATLAAKKLNSATAVDYGLTCTVPADAVDENNKFSSSFSVTLSCTSAEGRQILYSLDGTVPSLVYDDAITISKNTILRYAVADNGTICKKSGKDFIEQKYFIKNSSDAVTIKFVGSTYSSSGDSYDEINTTKLGNYLYDNYGSTSSYYCFMTYVPEQDLFISDPGDTIQFCIIMDNKSEKITDNNSSSSSSPYYLKLTPVTYVPANLPVLIRVKTIPDVCMDNSRQPKDFTVTVYKDDSNIASYADGKYKLNGNTFVNYLHYYDNETTEVPKKNEQEESGEYYYGLTYKEKKEYWDYEEEEQEEYEEHWVQYDCSPRWKQITSGMFKKRKAFLKTNAPLVSSSASSSGAGAKEVVSFQFDGSFDLVKPATDETATQVEMVKTDETATTGVYTLQGIRLAVDASALQTLPKGIYIVNGKKFLVK